MDLPVFIHSGHPPFSLPHSIIQLAEDFPKVRIVMVHMGHGNGIYIQAAIDLSKKHDNVYLETSGMPESALENIFYRNIKRFLAL